MDLSSIMRKAQEVKERMEQVQAEMDKAEFEGSAGGGMVKVIINGKGTMKKISFDDSVIESKDKELLEDLTIAAFNDAKAKLEDKLSNEMGGDDTLSCLPKGFADLF